MLRPDFDLVIVGAGIVGLATALAVTERNPGLGVAIVEKEEDLARHQTGHNSGVVHSGIYYRPGSLRAQLCRRGVGLLTRFSEQHGLKMESCGKVIVATTPQEVPALELLYERGIENGVPGLELIDGPEVSSYEPHARAVKAIWSPSTAIIDYTEVARAYAHVLRERGVHFEFGSRVESIREEGAVTRIGTSKGEIRASYLVNCAGLYSDKLARMAGTVPPVQIVPFRGEYYQLTEAARDLVRGTIYPVPDPNFPFLGVHLTRTVNGEVEAGPNAVFAFAREGYHWSRINPRELVDSLAYRGTWQLALKHWRVGAYEYYRSFSKRAFVESLRRLVPDLREDQVERHGAGVRAQALNPDGSLVDDFVFVRAPRSLHVLNAPSPAATASLAIGEHVAGEIARSWQGASERVA